MDKYAVKRNLTQGFLEVNGILAEMPMTGWWSVAEQEFHKRVITEPIDDFDFWVTVFIQCPYCSTEYDNRTRNDEVTAEERAKAQCRVHISKMHHDKTDVS